MIYKDFKGLRISQMAFGAMRLPLKSKDNSDIDMEKAAELVDRCMSAGVNYYDTAWGYHDGRSETAMGELLKRYPRDSFFLADKFPGYDLANMTKAEEIFEEQLRKCQVDHFDFYLIHNVCETNIEQYLDPQYGIVPYFLEMKKAGRIRHLGFSCHSNFDNMVRFLDAYDKDMEFCQIQLNYIDYSMQDAKRKVEYLDRAGIPIWVMEPLRGGKIVPMTEPFMDRLEEIRPGDDPAAWAFRFLQSFPEVVTILTGISDMGQTEEKIRLFSKKDPLSGKEMETLMSVVDEMLSQNLVPCTSCRYCTSHCPMGLDIPSLIDLYNEHRFSKGGFIAPMAVSALPEGKRPDACLGCGKCEKVCPQQIGISGITKDFVKILAEYPMMN